MSKQKRLLILGASDFQLPAILKAKEMGLTVAVADMNPNAVGVPYADRFYCVSTIDQEGVLKAAKDFGADGIMTLCTDMPMRALAHTCESLGLTGLDYRSAVRATDKGEMIRAFEACGVEHPKFLVISKDQDYMAACAGLDYPLITKPTDNSGSRGIMLVENAEQLREALQYSSENGRAGDVIVEEYMRGPEVSVELMVIDGVPHVLQITDKLTSGAPHFVETGHSEPSGLSEEARMAIADLAGRAALAVGIRNGPGHAEVILTDYGPKMVEIGARMGGGCITTHLVPLSTGIDMTRATIQLALGEVPDISQTIRMGSAIRFILPHQGIVTSITGAEEAMSIPGIKAVEIQCQVGQKLTELESGASRIGYVIAQSDDAQKAIRICEKALSCIRISVEEL